DIFNRYLNDESQLATWLGQYVTDPKYPDLEQQPEDEISLEQIKGALEDGDLLLTRNEGSRFSYYQIADNKVILFADGTSFECEGPTCALATSLCQNVNIVINQGDWSDQALQILVSLLNQGSVYCE
ncbi:winged helix domain-containing protein, partial [Pontibacterium sp.]|uniref:winged helix domain-containing protein n=1 Tax=Pontibacterium sp. TaxID=2036026 RepID=UPI0035697DF3